MDKEKLKYNLDKVNSEISESCKKHGRNSEDVKLIAVSKTFPLENIIEAFNLGQKAFGESYPQELRDKVNEINEMKSSGKLPESFEPEFHFIGNLQRNKVKYLIGNVELIHSVSSLKLLKEINKLAEKNNTIQKCLLQFNISGEESKGGLEKSDLKDILSEAEGMSAITINGVMGISGLESDDTERNNEFKRLIIISEELQTIVPDAIEISMGMSGDYDIAISQGSTMLRIGSAIFGERDYSNK